VEAIINKLLEYGLQGVVIAYLAYKNYSLEKDLKELNRTLIDYSQQVAKDNLEEHKNTLNALNNFTQSFNELKSLIYETLRGK
jgi:hypothetical protein